MAPVTGASEENISEAVVGSGAEDSVAPPTFFAGQVVALPMSREGRRCRTANGSPIPNLGQTIAHFRGVEGRLRDIPVQAVKGEAVGQRVQDGRCRL